MNRDCLDGGSGEAEIAAACLPLQGGLVVVVCRSTSVSLGYGRDEQPERHQKLTAQRFDRSFPADS